jgi:hypothetical protein
MDSPACDSCFRANPTLIISKHPYLRSTRPFQVVHMDTCGKMTTPTTNREIYFILFTDNFSRYRWVFCITDKSQGFPVIQKFFSAVSNQYRSQIAELVFDNGTEFEGQQNLTMFLQQLGCNLINLPHIITHRMGLQSVPMVSSLNAPGKC